MCGQLWSWMWLLYCQENLISALALVFMFKLNGYQQLSEVFKDLLERHLCWCGIKPMAYLSTGRGEESHSLSESRGNATRESLAVGRTMVETSCLTGFLAGQGSQASALMIRRWKFGHGVKQRGQKYSLPVIICLFRVHLRSPCSGCWQIIPVLPCGGIFMRREHRKVDWRKWALTLTSQWSPGTLVSSLNFTGMKTTALMNFKTGCDLYIKMIFQI